MSSERRERSGIMLAHPVSDKKLETLPDKFLVQPKLRGQRGRTIWFHEEPYILSSYELEFKFVDHIRKELQYLPAVQYDGEIYNHTMSQQEINSICNRTVNKHKDSEQMYYVIYDYIPERENITKEHQAARLLFLETLKTDIQKLGLKHVKICNTYSATRENYMELASHFLKEGFEGIILRNPSGLYELKRSNNLLKWKPRDKTICKIVGYKEGTGWAEGMLGALIVEFPGTGVQFSVGTGPAFTKEKRKRNWTRRDKLLEKSLVVLHEPMNAATDDGVPICTAGKEIV